jgi:hypothetical protein
MKANKANPIIIATNTPALFLIVCNVAIFYGFIYIILKPRIYKKSVKQRIFLLKYYLIDFQ